MHTDNLELHDVILGPISRSMYIYTYYVCVLFLLFWDACFFI